MKMSSPTVMMQHLNPAPVILVTKDLNLQLKAKAIRLPCEDYLNDKVEARDIAIYDLRRLEITAGRCCGRPVDDQLAARHHDKEGARRPVLTPGHSRPVSAR